MTQRILMITEEPNNEAAQLSCREDLFNLKLNPFSQFFGRILFGSEKCFRASFKPELFMWMHANSIDVSIDNYEKEQNKLSVKEKYKKKYDFNMLCIYNWNCELYDGANKIEKFIKLKNNEIELIVAFGMNAGKIFFNEDAKIKTISTIFEDGLSTLCDVSNSQFKGMNIPVAVLPHTSANAQSYWMKYPYVWSKLVEEIQGKVCEICRDSNNCSCSSCK